MSVISVIIFFFLMIRPPPRSTRTDTLFPYTTLFRSEKPTVEPDTKVRPLLERGVPRSFHCPAKRKRCSMCIEQSQIIPLGSDKDVIKVAITEQRPQAGLECAIGREYLQCFGTTEGQRRIGSIERVKTGSGNDDDGRLPAARAGIESRTKQGRFCRRGDQSGFGRTDQEEATMPACRPRHVSRLEPFAGTRPRGQNGRRRWCAIHHQGAARGVEEVIAVAATIAKAVIIGFGARIEWARLAAFGIPARMRGIPAIGIADRSIPERKSTRLNSSH